MTIQPVKGQKIQLYTSTDFKSVLLISPDSGKKEQAAMEAEEEWKINNLHVLIPTYKSVKFDFIFQTKLFFILGQISICSATLPLQKASVLESGIVASRCSHSSSERNTTKTIHFISKNDKNETDAKLNST